MTSMAAAIAASLPAQATPEPAPAPAPAKVPARMEGFLDVEASRDVESVKLNSLVSRRAGSTRKDMGQDSIALREQELVP